MSDERKSSLLPVVDCPIAAEWSEFLNDQKEVHKQMAQVYALATNFSQYVKHLEKLDSLPKLEAISRDMKDKLIDSATGRKQFDKDAVMLMIKIFGGVIASLVVCIIFLLTGQHLGFINLVGH